MTPGKIRNELEQLDARAKEIERELISQAAQGVVTSHEIGFEVTEASEALARAIDLLDKSYGGML